VALGDGDELGDASLDLAEDSRVLVIDADETGSLIIGEQRVILKLLDDLCRGEWVELSQGLFVERPAASGFGGTGQAGEECAGQQRMFVQIASETLHG
jgi:hypothetical protein